MSGKLMNSWLRWTVMTVLTATLAGGFGMMLFSRYHGTDVYPEYSSFRADQFGAKVLYESLRGLGLDVSRNLRPLKELDKMQESCIVIAGLPGNMLDHRNLIDMVSAGARVVIGFVPGSGMPDEDKDRKKPAHDLDKNHHKGFQLNVDLMSMTTPSKLPGIAKPEAGQDNLPPLNYYSSNYFRVSADWKVLYTFYSKPVIVERKLGKGMLILCADNFIFTNEAVAKDKNAALLLRVLGSRQRIVFDETHLGVVSERNLAWLAGKYELGPFAIILAITLLLFLWRQLTAVSGGGEKLIVEAKGRADLSGLALTALLRSAFRVRDLPKLCLDCWLESAAGRRCDSIRLQRMKEAVTAADPLKAYNHATEQYHRRKDCSHE